MVDKFENMFKIPIIIENNANCAVFGEKWLSLSSEYKNVIYLMSGVSSGIVINDQVYMGSTGCAGEFGIINFNALDNYDWKKESFGLGRWDLELGMLNDIDELYKKFPESIIFLTNLNFGCSLACLQEASQISNSGCCSARASNPFRSSGTILEGFSNSMCFPAITALTKISKWVEGGVQI